MPLLDARELAKKAGLNPEPIGAGAMVPMDTRVSKKTVSTASSSTMPDSAPPDPFLPFS